MIRPYGLINLLIKLLQKTNWSLQNGGDATYLLDTSMDYKRTGGESRILKYCENSKVMCWARGTKKKNWIRLRYIHNLIIYINALYDER